MALSERIVCQPYIKGKRGNLVPGPQVACRNPEEAIRRAERAIAAGSVAGAHVVRVLADEATGDFGEPDYLAAFGTVPEPGEKRPKCRRLNLSSGPTDLACRSKSRLRAAAPIVTAAVPRAPTRAGRSESRREALPRLAARPRQGRCVLQQAERQGKACRSGLGVVSVGPFQKLGAFPMARQVTTAKSAAKGKAPLAAQAAPKAPPKAAARAAAQPATAKEPKKPPAKAAAVPVEAPAKPAAPATVTLKHLAAGLAERHDMQKREAEAVVADVFGRVVDHLKAGERVRIGGLGIIEVKDRPAQMGRNPATGEAVQIKASRKVAFRASKDLKDAI